MMRHYDVHDVAVVVHSLCKTNECVFCLGVALSAVILCLCILDSGEDSGDICGLGLDNPLQLFWVIRELRRECVKGILENRPW